MEAIRNTGINNLFSIIIEKNLNAASYQWLLEKAGALAGTTGNYQLNLAFTSMPRKTGKKEIIVEDFKRNAISEVLPGLIIDHWTIDRLCRVWLLMQLEMSDKESYVQRIENLFPQAEMNEQVALYSALPLLAYPEAWKSQCAIGVRSNIDTVLDAVMYYNPYPAAYLEEPAWNQMIMKAFFTGKNVDKIVGVDNRANQHLADMLFDYVEERWAAHRKEDPQIWRLTSSFLDEKHMYMMEMLWNEADETHRQAAALACSESSLEKAKRLLETYPTYKQAIQQNTLHWKVVADKINY